MVWTTIFDAGADDEGDSIEKHMVILFLQQIGTICRLAGAILPGGVRPMSPGTFPCFVQYARVLSYGSSRSGSVCSVIKRWRKMA